MQQLVLDDVTTISRPVGTPHVNAKPPTP
jgi:hypothetical protein